MPVIDGEKNLDKLSDADLKKALNTKSSSEFLDIVMNQKNKTKPVSEKSTIEQTEEAAHTVDPKNYEANINEQTSLMVDGSQVINERIEELKTRLKGKDEKTTIMGMEVEELNFAGESKEHTNEDHAIEGRDDDESDSR